MKNGLVWLRIGYWVAGIADFVVAVIVLIPERMGVSGYVYPMGLMASVAFSWGVLLLVADRKPLERRWIVLPTILVVSLLGGTAVHAGFIGIIPLSRAVATAVVSLAVLTVLTFGYRRSSDLVRAATAIPVSAPGGKE